MQCVVLNCEHFTSNGLKGVTYHKFPAEPSLRADWLQALHLADGRLAERSAVCSRHFQQKDLLVSSDGRCALRPGAVPVFDVQVCRVCFATGCKLYSMKTYKILSKEYETLTKLLLTENEDNLPPYLCSTCARQLLLCGRFRTTSLGAHLVLLDIVNKHGCISLDLIQSAKRPIPFNSMETNNYDYDLETKLTEKESFSYSEGQVLTMNSPDSKENIVTKEPVTEDIKVENVIDQNSPNAEEALSENDLYMTNFYNNIADDDIKIENEGVCNERVKIEEGTPAEKLSIESMEHSGSLVGEYSSANSSLVLKKAGQEAKSSSAGAIHERLPGAAPRNTAADGELLIINKLSCEVCPYQADKKPDLLDHLKAHAATVSYSCDSCSYTTTCRSSLEGHVRAHLCVKPYTCDVCNKSFNRQGNYVTHVKKHWGEKPVSRDIDVRVLDASLLSKEHQKIHSGKKTFSCDICHRAYFQKGHLTRHTNTHSGEKRFMCEVCPYSFGQRDSLVKHMKIHSGKKPFSCDNCNYACSEKWDLITHMRTHTGQRPFSCSVCRMAFNRKSNLTMHTRIHSGHKPFSCEVCHNSFTRKSSLTKHIRIHSGEKPFSCNICCKTFSYKYSLTTHMRMHSGEKLGSV